MKIEIKDVCDDELSRFLQRLMEHLKVDPCDMRDAACSALRDMDDPRRAVYDSITVWVVE